jgi:hypothetical protein
VNYENDQLIPKDKAFLSKITTNPYALIKDAKITNWTSIPKDSDGNVIEGAPGQLRFSIDTYSHHIKLRDREYPVINNCTFTGVVKEVDVSGKISLRASYSNPKSREIKHRIIPVLSPHSYAPELMNDQVMVIGRVCGKKPGGEDQLYVVGDQIVSIA